MRYIDPSGHRCLPEDECETPHGDKHTDVPLTTATNDAGTNGGQNMYKLYLFMSIKRGYNVYEFLAWGLAIESSGQQDLFDMLLGIASNRLWKDHINAVGAIDIVAACRTSSCFNGIFNYLGEYSQSAWGRYENYAKEAYDRVLADPQNFENYDISSAGLKLATGKSGTYGNGTPMHFGFWSRDPKESDPGAWWVPNMLNYFGTHPDDEIGNGAYQIAYMRKNENGTISVVYTVNQAETWKNWKNKP